MSVVLDAPVELWSASTPDDKQAVIRAVYKHKTQILQQCQKPGLSDRIASILKVLKS